MEGGRLGVDGVVVVQHLDQEVEHVRRPHRQTEELSVLVQQ